MDLTFPLTVRKAFDDLLLLVGIEIASNAPMYIRERVLNDINATMQVMQTSGEDYFLREDVNITLPQGQVEFQLSGDIQSIIGPVKTADGYSLHEVQTHGEIDKFVQMYLGQNALGQTGKPLAYYVHPMRDNSGDGDAMIMNVIFAPTPDADYQLALHVVKVAQIFTYADLSDETKLIPVVHKYAQSVFLPLARYSVMTCPWFRRPELAAAITADYHRALNILGVGADPSGTGLTDDLKDRKKMAARAAAREAYNATV